MSNGPCLGRASCLAIGLGAWLLEPIFRPGGPNRHDLSNRPGQPEARISMPLRTAAVSERREGGAEARGSVAVTSQGKSGGVGERRRHRIAMHCHPRARENLV
jgi:hypothetical protein